MRSLVVERLAPDYAGCVLKDVPTPEPARGEARLKVRAASINPGEAKIREGLVHARWPATFPSGEG